MNSPLKLLLAATFLTALSWIALMPLWQYPDEQAHFAQVQYIAEVKGVPQNNRSFDTSYEVAVSEKILGTERDEFGNNKFTYHPEYKPDYSNNFYGPYEKEITSLPKSVRSQLVKNEATLNPPLYYNLSALVYKLFSWGDLFTRVFAVRIFSAMIFLAAVLVAFKTGKIVFGKNQILPISLAAIIASTPMLIFASTGVLPDALTNLLFSIFILISLSMISEGWSTRKIAAIGLIIILGAATRQNFLISLFIFPFVILHQLLFDRKSRIKIFITIVIFGVALFIASYFIPALDFIHRFDYPESSQKIPSHSLAQLTYFDHLIWTVRHSAAEVWPWYWGVYKWLSLALPPIVYQVINRLIPLAFIGLLIKIASDVKNRRIKEISGFFFLIYSVFVYFMLLAIFDFFHRKNNGFSFGIQGRYFFPVIIPSLALVLTGFQKIFETVSQNLVKIGIFILIVLFFIFNDFSLAYVSASYYSTETLATFISQASQYKPEIFKGNILASILVAAVIFQAIFLCKLYTYIIKSK